MYLIDGTEYFLGFLNWEFLTLSGSPWLCPELTQSTRWYHPAVCVSCPRSPASSAHFTFAICSGLGLPMPSLGPGLGGGYIGRGGLLKQEEGTGTGRVR